MPTSGKERESKKLKEREKEQGPEREREQGSEREREMERGAACFNGSAWSTSSRAPNRVDGPDII